MAVLGATTGAFAQSMDQDNMSLSLRNSWSLDAPYDSPGDDDAKAYANITTFSGSVSLNGGSANGITRLQADDINLGAWSVIDNSTLIKGANLSVDLVDVLAV